jgi:hypothetical protein
VHVPQLDWVFYCRSYGNNTKINIQFMYNNASINIKFVQNNASIIIHVVWLVQVEVVQVSTGEVLAVGYFQGILSGLMDGIKTSESLIWIGWSIQLPILERKSHFGVKRV